MWGNGLSCFWMPLLFWLPLPACRTKAVAVFPSCQWDASLSMSAQAWTMTLLGRPISHPGGWTCEFTAFPHRTRRPHPSLPSPSPFPAIKDPWRRSPTFTGFLMPPSPKWVSYQLAQTGGKVHLMDSLLFFWLIKWVVYRIAFSLSLLNNFSDFWEIVKYI